MDRNNGQSLSQLTKLNKDSKTLQALYSCSPDMLALYSGKGVINDVSPASFTLLGYKRDDMIGRKLFEFCHPQDRNTLERVFTQGNPSMTTYRMRRKRGDYIWIETRFNKIDDVEHLVGSSRDVTDRELRRESEEKYRFLVEQSPETIGICHNDRWVFLNQAGLKLFGVVDLKEILGRDVEDCIHPDDQPFFRQQMSLLKQGTEDVISFNVKFVRDDGEIRHVKMKWSQTFNDKETTLQVFVQDMTKEKQTEEILIRTEKLSVAGQLAASIAHEIRNPLTSIKGFAQLMYPNLENEDYKKYINTMLTELDRIENIVSNLLVISKEKATRTEKTDLWPLIYHTTTLLYSEALIQGVEIVTDIEPQLPPIECAPEQIKQVFTNVLKNALEASSEHGKVWIKARLLGEDRLKIQFVDEGSGIPEERIDKLWQPFYTTKEKGTGLGMMICKRIVENHRGEIHVASEPDQGTTVTILLPIYHD